MPNGIIKILFFLIIASSFVSPAEGRVLNKDTVWRDKVVLDEDILVPKGVVLTVLPGTVVSIGTSDRTRTDPEYLSSLPEITVRGRLDVKGEKDLPVLFHIQGENSSGIWSGIIIDGGSAHIRSSLIEDAENGISVLEGLLKIDGTIIRNNRYGLVSYGKNASVFITESVITGNDYGVFVIGRTEVTYSKSIVVKNLKKDLYVYGAIEEKSPENDNVKSDQTDIYRRSDNSCSGQTPDLRLDYKAGSQEITRKYEDEVLIGDTVWRGRIEINGLIRVPENARLIIMPGTIVEFKKKDTNGDGIGENGIMMQGVFIAKGTGDNPIIFRSAEDHPEMGDWDAINIMNSDGTNNLIEYSQIEDAYRGVHFHFSNVTVSDSVLKNNYRAIQFQESSVELRGNFIYDNKSGIKARDSRISFFKNNVFHNINGVNFFRTEMTAHRNYISGNLIEGFRIREGTNTVFENFVDCNRFGMMVNNVYFGLLNGNVVSNNIETGISIRDSDNIELSGNFIQGNGFNGINILSSGVLVKENNISENGERGIGIQSFAGAITGNNIIENGLYAIENESAYDISAEANWWGKGDVERKIYDKSDDPARGAVVSLNPREEPVTFLWPVKIVHSDITWRDSVIVKDHVEIRSGATLKILPGTKVMFNEGAGMRITDSKILAIGEKDKRILFTSSEKGGSTWDEILLEHANGSTFSYSDFEYADWALHSHFTDLKVINSHFRKNKGGMRFRSGPISIAGSLFTRNRIGMRAFRANALITGNTFTNNEIGVFVREKGGGLTLRNNNMYSNEYYNIRVGDFDKEDVDARENWWGTMNPAETFFDGRREQGVGKVIFEPYHKERLIFNSEDGNEKL